MSDSKSTYGEPVEEPRPVDDVVGSANEGLTDAEAAGRDAAPYAEPAVRDEPIVRDEPVAANGEPAPAHAEPVVRDEPTPAHAEPVVRDEPAPAHAEPVVRDEPTGSESCAAGAPAVASEPVAAADERSTASPLADSTDDEITDAAAYHAAYNASYDDEPAAAEGSVAARAYDTPADPSATGPAVAPSEPVSGSADSGATTAAGATAAGATAAGATAAAAPQPIFVQAPEPPRARGNRAAAGAIGLLAALSFVVIFLAAWLGIGLVRGDVEVAGIVPALTRTLTSWVFWTPVVLFFIGFWLLGAIINRGRWAHWVVFGLFVGLFSWFGFILGELFQAPFWSLTASEGVARIQDNLFAPLAVIAFIIGRELTIWFGAWVAARGKRVTEINTEAQREYERTLEAGPQLYRQ
ncbi:ABC transporter [Microbacterium sp. BK668]|uniref:ABC transporter n=1 Tax=Microbacterium sp. BK668 TaxID=2512118 RepID=UPI0010E144C4|nr:ABC transporter [Microbacterium sp. BK668]TDN90610.1 hypothetical protein EV279_0097 [Microbacterium sp. BK668]